jgi:Cu/Ag efflux pump CusA
MTSFATIFGILPIALGLGEGAEARRPLGIAVVGGMFFSTFLTLLLVPAMYSLVGRRTGSGRIEEAAPGREETEQAIPASGRTFRRLR